MKAIDVERVRALFDYDRQTGTFRWKVRLGTARPGSLAGCKSGCGYTQIGIDGTYYLAHRMAWALENGDDPSAYIDHINGDRRDNRIANLRLTSIAQNAQNQRRPQAGNKSGFLGVEYDRRRAKYRSSIQTEDGRMFLGYFETAEAASEAYLTKKREVHPYGTL